MGSFPLTVPPPPLASCLDHGGGPSCLAAPTLGVEAPQALLDVTPKCRAFNLML